MRLCAKQSQPFRPEHTVKVIAFPLSYYWIEFGERVHSAAKLGLFAADGFPCSK